MTHKYKKKEAIPWYNRDISWLKFNYRVLQEVQDKSNPLFERVKFYAIFSSNLEEFFRVRMAHYRLMLRIGKKTQKQLEDSPKDIIARIQEMVNQMQMECSYLFENELIPQLKEAGIILKRRNELTKKQKVFVDDYFQNHMLPFVQPVLLEGTRVRPFLKNSALYLAVQLKVKEAGEFFSKSEKYRIGIVIIPSEHLPRFIELLSEGDKHELIVLDEVVRQSLDLIFPGYSIEGAFSIKLTRDAELYIDDEYEGDLVDKIKTSLSKRHVGPTSRFVYDARMPQEVLNELARVFHLEKYDFLKEGRYHNNSDFFGLPNFGIQGLTDEPLPPLPYYLLEDTDDYFGAITQKDHFINMPYHSYESVVKFFEEAATDPLVTHIKIAQYRVARKSRIMEALKKAVQNGKHVFAFIEVKARFDEEANLRWGEKLEKAGVKVSYSLPGIKVHSKLALIRRKEDGVRGKLYAYLSTGNFHEGTAKLYSDFGLFTKNYKITTEVARVFNYLESQIKPRTPFKHMLVGKYNMREELYSLIEYEIKEAKAGRPASIYIKLNSLQDAEIINYLYAASRAGVKIKMIIRGICCLVPGVSTYSENIQGISIVDRYLEHARAFIFYHGGKELTYLSSADWMKRNLSYRIETAFPIYDPTIKEKIKDLLNIQWNDNVKARIIDENQKNEFVELGDNEQIAIRSQLETYYYFKRLNSQYLLAQKKKQNKKSKGNKKTT